MGSAVIASSTFYDDVYEGLTANEVYKKQARDAYAYFSDNNESFRDQFLFWMLNQQWDDATRTKRTADSKPTLTFNMGYSLINEILGEDRNATPGLVIRSDDERYEKQAEIMDGLVRQIMYASRLDVLRQTVLRCCIVGGFGVFEIKREYESPNSMHQVLRLYADEEAPANYFDPSARESDKQDGDFCGRIYRLSKFRYKKLYPDSSTFLSFPVYGDSWQTNTPPKPGEYIFIARHFIKEYSKKTLVLLSNGETVEKKKLNEEIEKRMRLQQMLYAAGRISYVEEIKAIDDREVLDYKIIERHLNYDEVLEESEWPGKYFPLIFVDGDSSYFEGQQYTKGFAKFAQDQQRLLNYERSELAVYLLNAEREGFIGTPANFEGYEDEWANKHRAKGMLRANPDPLTGQMPIPIEKSPFPASLINLDASFVENVRDILNRNRSMDGSSAQNRSGVAELTRIRQGNNGANVYIDNVNRGMESVGRTLVSLIPHVYDTTREITVRDVEENPSKVIINQPAQGMSYINGLDVDEFHIKVEAGGSFAQQREVQNKMLLELAAINPAVNAVIPDLIAKNLDLSNSAEVIERIQHGALPPEIKQQVLKEPQQPQPPNPALLIQQQKLNNEAMNMQLKQEEMELQREKMALDSRNALLQHQATIAKTQAETYRAEKQVQQTAMAHHTKTNEFHHDEKIKQLYEENEKLKRILSQAIGINPTQGNAADESEYAA